jgi:hypothetical protein
MMPPISSRRALAARRLRTLLVWGAALVVLAQVGLNLALSASWELRDPEFGLRLSALRQRQAERGADRPLVVLLGSSQVAINFRPDVMRVNGQQEAGPLAFNCGICRAGPAMELLCLRRLISAGTRPSLVVAELYYAVLDLSDLTGDGQHQGIATDRLSWADARALSRLSDQPRSLRLQWGKAHLLPWAGLRRHVCTQWAPWLLDDASARRRDEWAVDGWGRLWCPTYRDDPNDVLAARRARSFEVGKGYAEVARRCRVSPQSKRALEEMVLLCRREGIRLAFLLMPDPFLPQYSPAAEARLDEIHFALGVGLGAPVIDLRDRVAEDDFFDGLHMTDSGAARFTREVEPELVRFLSDGADAGRWAPEKLCPTAVARRRLEERMANSVAE